MILSVSRRTDIPAFYSDWFFNRLKEGFVYVRNPMNIHQVSKITLSPDVIDCIVFWSKNPSPMLYRLDELKDYMYYFQFTINAYDKNLEFWVPRKGGIINTFRALSNIIGPKRVIWRYDPIMLSSNMDIAYHVHYFGEIAKRLGGYTDTCVISFVDLYKKAQNNLKGTTARELSINEMLELSAKLYIIASRYGMKIQTCSEGVDFNSVGVVHGKCIDNKLIEELLGVRLRVDKDQNQRKECGCVQSIDIGEYNTCYHGCKYCYANFNERIVMRNKELHDPYSPLLIGHLGVLDRVTERKLVTFVRKMEDFKVGDIIQLKHPDMFKKTYDIYNYGINLYMITSIGNNYVKLAGINKEIPKAELEPVTVDGVADRWIYYDPVIMAPFVFPGDEVPTFRVDYSYYMDSFKRTYEDGQSFRDIIIKARLGYVHEIQHFLRKKFNHDYLKINEYKY